MATSRIIVERTPNPNSMKVVIPGVQIIPDGMMVYSDPEDAEDDTLASSLFGLDGVDNIFVVPGFLTITKTHGAEWTKLLPRVTAIVEAYFGLES